MAIACAGYRVVAKTGHHKVAFDSITLALGAGADKYADYFEGCRRKRNVINYTDPTSQVTPRPTRFSGSLWSFA
jgi:hypothetical protein